MMNTVRPQVVYENLIAVVLYNTNPNNINPNVIKSVLENQYPVWRQGCEFMVVNFTNRGHQNGVYKLSLTRTFIQSVKTNPKYDVFKKIYPLIITGAMNESENVDLREFIRALGFEKDSDVQGMIIPDYYHFPQQTLNVLVQKTQNITKFSPDVYQRIRTPMLFIPIYFGKNAIKKKYDIKNALEKYRNEYAKGKEKMDIEFVEEFLKWRACEIDEEEFFQIFSPLNPRDGDTEFRKQLFKKEHILVFSKPVYLEMTFDQFTKRFPDEDVKQKLDPIIKLLKDPMILASYDTIQLIPWSTNSLAEEYGMKELFAVPTFGYISGNGRIEEMLRVKENLIKYCYEFVDRTLNFTNNDLDVNFKQWNDDISVFFEAQRRFKRSRIRWNGFKKEILEPKEETTLERTERMMKQTRDDLEDQTLKTPVINPSFDSDGDDTLKFRDNTEQLEKSSMYPSIDDGKNDGKNDDTLDEDQDAVDPSYLDSINSGDEDSDLKEDMKSDDDVKTDEKTVDENSDEETSESEKVPMRQVETNEFYARTEKTKKLICNLSLDETDDLLSTLDYRVQKFVKTKGVNKKIDPIINLLGEDLLARATSMIRECILEKK